MPRIEETPALTKLVSRARSGEPEAIAELYQRYGEPVFWVAYRLMGSSADAEDVLHDVFLGLPEALRTYEARGDLGAWIRQVAVRTALMRLRTVKRKREVDLTAANASREAPPSSVDRVAIEAALAAMPDTLRQVFVLREIEGYSHSEISSMLGIRVGASKVRLLRARKVLREFLKS